MAKRMPPEFFVEEAARYGVTPNLYQAAWELLRHRRTQLLSCDRCSGTKAVIVDLLNELRRANEENADLRRRLSIRSRSIPAAVRRAVVERDGDRCRYCGKRVPEGKRNFDHVIPAINGGQETVDNIVVACQPCNQRKGHRSLGSYKFRMRLRPAPGERLTSDDPHLNMRDAEDL